MALGIGATTGTDRIGLHDAQDGGAAARQPFTVPTNPNHVAAVPPPRPSHRPPPSSPALLALHKQNQMLEEWRGWAGTPDAGPQARQALQRLNTVLRSGGRTLDLSGLAVSGYPNLLSGMVVIEDERPAGEPAMPPEAPTHNVAGEGGRIHDRAASPSPPLFQPEARLDPGRGAVGPTPKQQALAAWTQWARAGGGERETRGIAFARLKACLESGATVLDLRGLRLNELPDIPAAIEEVRLLDSSEPEIVNGGDHHFAVRANGGNLAEQLKKAETELFRMPGQVRHGAAQRSSQAAPAHTASRTASPYPNFHAPSARYVATPSQPPRAGSPPFRPAPASPSPTRQACHLGGSYAATAPHIPVAQLVPQPRTALGRMAANLRAFFAALSCWPRREFGSRASGHGRQAR